jgi:serine/threonine protein kinase
MVTRHRKKHNDARQYRGASPAQSTITGMTGGRSMQELSNCLVETLTEDDEFSISRVRAEDAFSSWLLISLASDRRATGLAKLQHAYALREELDVSWAIRPLELADFRGRPALLHEDPGGCFLSQLLDRPLSVPEFLRSAIGIATALADMHRRGLVHQDVKPANLIVNLETGAAWLAGFGIASRLTRRHQSKFSGELSGTLAYMAPEQSGRMGRSIDSRSDLYSLGVTFYEMLVGAPPFVANDPTEWVHCHLARSPVPPKMRKDDVPDPLSALVMKLLAKAPEDRFQTAAGVLADLRRCLAAWEAVGQIEPFSLGTHDKSGQLVITEKLYGREREVREVLAAVSRVANRGNAELILISGYSGVGKSSVVSELYKVLVPPRGLFCLGQVRSV